MPISDHDPSFHSSNGHTSRSRSRRQSLSSNWTSSTSATLTSGLTLDQDNGETFAGTGAEAVPSSIVSFHHPHSIQSSNFLSSSLNSEFTQRQQQRRRSSARDTQPLMEQPGPERFPSDLSRRPSFRFFTEEEINNAEGTATLENTDYDIRWDPKPSYEQQRIYGSDIPSRRSSVNSVSRRSSLSRGNSYGTTGSYMGHPLARSDSLARQSHAQDLSEAYRTNSTDSSASLSRYSVTERIPIELEEQEDDILDNSSSIHSMSLSASSSNSQENDEGNNNGNDEVHSHHKKNSYQNEFLKPIYHEKFYPLYSPEQSIQRFYITEEDIVIGIAGYCTSTRKKIFYNILCILTLGLLSLLMRWLPAKKVNFIGEKCPLGKAEWVAIENEFGEFVVETVKREWYNRPLSTVLHIDKESFMNSGNNSNTGTHHHHTTETNPNIPILITFQYRYITFIFSPLEDIFKTNTNWVDPDWLHLPSVLKGLPSIVQEDRILAFERNHINLKMKTTSEILFDEVLHPFYIFQIFSIILWSLDEYYYYASCIFLISVMSIGETLIETKKTSRNLAEMSNFSCDVRVLRDEFWTSVNSSELVPGDIYEISDPSLKILPCDSILATGDCIVNESMLTGESVPVSKTPANEDTMYQLMEDFENTQISSFVSKSFLFSGTNIIRAKVPPGQSAALAMVVRTGFSTTKGSLVRSMVFPKPMGFKFYSDSFKYIGVMTIIAMLGFSISCIQFVKLGLDKSVMILRALDIITIVVPPALPATLTIGTSFSLSRLKKKGIFCISPTRVNVGGKVDLMCFDKTGTLTEDGLDVLGVQISEPSGHNSFKFGELKENVNDVFNKSSLNECKTPLDVKCKNLLMSILTCHSLRVVDDELIGDPLDYKMFEFTGWSYNEDLPTQNLNGSHATSQIESMFPETVDMIPAVVHPSDKDKESKFAENDSRNYLGIVRSFEFLSELRRMSVIVKPNGDELYWAFTKGAPEVIADICNKTTLPSNYEEILHYYTHSGHRIIACAGKILPKHTWLYSQKVARDEVENNMEFLGFIIFENKLKAPTAPTLKVLQEANIRTVMCTGDNVLTAISVGRESGLITSNNVYVPYLNDPNDDFLVWRDVDDYDKTLDTVTLQPLDHDQDYTIAVTGEVFRMLFSNENEIPEDYINEILLNTSVYARMSPDEKHELMERLQKLDYTVGFCGDGANDCGALKAADIGISLSEAEASVAAPFTSKVFDISCVLDVIKEGRASLVTSFSCFQYMSLYSAIQFISISILYSRGSNLGDFQFLYIDLFLIIPIAIFMSWSKPYDKLSSKRPSANLVSLKILIPLFLSFVIILFFQMIPWIFVQTRDWYIKPIVGGDDAVQSSDNTILFYISNFQYILTAVILSVGPPYREPMSQNRGFIIDILLSIVVSVVLMFVNVDSMIGDLFQLTEITWSFKMFICLWVMLNYFIQLNFPNAIKPFFKKKQSSKKYKNIIKCYKDMYNV
ncbi:vacuolar cation-transporting ATPase Ypk9p [Monosporozyma servazzii]